MPLLMVVRFGILGPASIFHRGLREWVLTAASAAVVNPYYRKRFPRQDEKHLMIVEALCFAYLCMIAALVVAVDRQERGTGEQSALKELEREFSMPCFAIASIAALMSTPVTRSPPRASGTATRPVPQPSSSTVSPWYSARLW